MLYRNKHLEITVSLDYHVIGLCRWRGLQKQHEHKPKPHLAELEKAMDGHFFLSASLSQASFT